MANHVFIEREKKEKSKSGIILLTPVEQSRESVMQGIVRALGSGCSDNLNLGDRVVFNQGMASEINLGGDDWIFSVPEGSILLVMEP